ncbi:hypothetical protein [Polycladidibacter stylochi]|nr:hypothetical protein [Pseudovibrio stylochi]
MNEPAKYAFFVHMSQVVDLYVSATVAPAQHRKQAFKENRR